jgi:hypothetical protein
VDLNLVFVVVVAALIVLFAFMSWHESRRPKARRRPPGNPEPADQPLGDREGPGGPPRHG